MIYLASPYSHPDPAIREARYNAALLCAANCLKGGQSVFSPIVYGHPLNAIEPALGTSAAAWTQFNTAMIRHATTVCVLMLDGWESSVGVMAEITMAKMLGIPIYYLAHRSLDKVEFN